MIAPISALCVAREAELPSRDASPAQGFGSTWTKNRRVSRPGDALFVQRRECASGQKLARNQTRPELAPLFAMGSAAES